MAEKGSWQFLRCDAAAVICHPDQPHTAVADFHRHGGGTGVDGVFHQLLDHAGGALHHFAGGDQVGHMGVQLFNVGHVFVLSNGYIRMAHTDSALATACRPMALHSVPDRS